MSLLQRVKTMLGSSSKKTTLRIVDELQIEAVYLPPAGTGQPAYMDWSTFTRCSGYFHLANKVKFAGWGDPLSHPEALKMLKVAKENCKQVEVHSSLAGQDYKFLQELVELGLTSLTVDLFHPKHTLDEIIDNLKFLLAKRTGQTKIILNYTMTTQNLHQLPQVVEVCGDLKVDQVVAGNIDLPLNEELNRLKVFQGTVSEADRGDLLKQGKAAAKKEYQDVLNEAQKVADRKRIYFDPKPLVPIEAVMCAFNPLKNAFITWCGKVTPCPYLGLEGFTSYFNETEYELLPFIAGDINSDDFTTLWNSPHYIQFRKVYEKRVRVFNKYMEETFENEPTAQSIFENYQKLDKQLVDYGLPEVCAKCYKAYGI